MEPLLYKPEGDPLTHEITAELVSEEGTGLIFLVRSDGEAIGEVDVEMRSEELMGYVSGVGPGEKINNGYLRPASFVILSCLTDRNPLFERLYDVDNEPLEPTH